MTASSATMQNTSHHQAKKAVPVILIFFVLALIIDNAFKLISVEIANDLGISATTVGWQATLAGLIIGIGAVVYASLADSISIRTLLTTGVFLICTGSILGYLFHDSFAVILFARVIQTAGLAAAETLYVIYVTKHLPKAEQKKFLGFSTSGFSLSLVIGSLMGGYISTYLHWTNLFLVPLITIFLLPLILKYLPKEKAKKANVDVIGLMLIAAIATSVMLYLSNFNWIYIIAFAVAAFLFGIYINKSTNSLINITFFQNRRFVSTLLVVFVVYSVQLAYIFMFPFLIEKVYGFRLDTISLMLIPGYVTAVIVGALSGKIAKFINSRQAVIIALVSIAISVFIPGLFTESSALIFVFSMILFSGSFALMYAPLLESCIRTMPKEKTGTAIGFYNLVINVAVSIGISYSAAMIDAFSFSQSLFVIAGIALSALLIFLIIIARVK